MTGHLRGNPPPRRREPAHTGSGPWSGMPKRRLNVQRAITTQTHDTRPGDLTDREDEFSDLLTLPRTEQDLLFRAARTADTFTDEPVTEAEVRAIYGLVKWAPTSMNNQPLRIVLVRSPEARADLVELMGEGNRPKTSTAPLVAILAADTDFHDEFPKTFPHFPGARDLFAQEDEARTRSAELNATLQIGYIILGVRAAGLAAGPMTGFDFDDVVETV